MTTESTKHETAPESGAMPAPTNGTAAILEELAERERAITALAFLPETKHFTIYCRRTGIPIAKMEFLQQVGKVPYLLQWKESQAFHPLFSLSQAQLLAWTRKNWNQLFRARTLDDTTDVQKQQFQIAFLAILHTLNCLDQQIPALPSFHTVNANMQRLLELAYWYNYLDSRRFKFPILRINKMNCNGTLSDINAYLDICESRKKDWESSKDARTEEQKLEAARKAEKAVRGSHVRAVSKKALWNWFLSSMADSNSKKYSLPEWAEWKEDMQRLFLAGENVQLQYSIDDCNAIEDVFLEACALGSTVSNAFKNELGKIRDNISNHLKVFELDWEATLAPTVRRVDSAGNTLGSSNVATNVPPEAGKEPQINEFFKRVDYIRAKAQWDVRRMQRAAWEQKYGTHATIKQDSKQDNPDSEEETGENDGN